MKIGIIGAGEVGHKLAGLIVQGGNEAVMCGRTSGSLREVLEQGIIILAVRWENIPDVMREVEDWQGKILIDATNQLTYSDDGSPVRVELDVTGSEYVAGLAKNARVIKAFGSLFSQYMDGITQEGRRVLFYAGDDIDAKREVYSLFCAMGFFPVDLGSLTDGGKLLQVGGALSGKHFVKRSDDLCL